MKNHTEMNRCFLLSLFQSIAKEGWGDNFMSVLHKELVFHVTGTSPLAGTYHGKENYERQVLERLDKRLASWPIPAIDNIIIDGNLACLQFHSTGSKGYNGTDFNMNYTWIFRIENNKILEIWGYYDSVKMCALFDEKLI